MSYCRFSSDDFNCDVYVYAACDGGFTTHVAGTRYVGDIPKLPRPTKENAAEYLAARRWQSRFLENASREPITLPHAGDSFSDDFPGACAKRLESLRAIGYHVPQYAIDALRAEAIAQGEEP